MRENMVALFSNYFLNCFYNLVKGFLRMPKETKISYNQRAGASYAGVAMDEDRPLSDLFVHPFDSIPKLCLVERIIREIGKGKMPIDKLGFSWGVRA